MSCCKKVKEAIQNLQEFLKTNALPKREPIESGLFNFQGNTVSNPNLTGSGWITNLKEQGGGLVRMTINGTNPTNTNGFTTNGPYHSGYGLNNVRLDLVRLSGSSTGSDYSVMYEIYN